MNWVHLHLALNHIPVLGSLFVGIMLATALIKRSEELKRLSFTWLVALAIVSIPIKFTGDFAHEAVAESDWLPASGVAAHEQSADQATTGMFLLGLMAAFGIYRGRGQRPIPGWVVGATMFLAFVTFALMARTANLGGQLRHEEIRSVGFHHHCPARRFHLYVSGKADDRLSFIRVDFVATFAISPQQPGSDPSLSSTTDHRRCEVC